MKLRISTQRFINRIELVWNNSSTLRGGPCPSDLHENEVAQFYGTHFPGSGGDEGTITVAEWNWVVRLVSFDIWRKFWKRSSTKNLLMRCYSGRGRLASDAYVLRLSELLLELASWVEDWVVANTGWKEAYKGRRRQSGVSFGCSIHHRLDVVEARLFLIEGWAMKNALF